MSKKIGLMPYFYFYLFSLRLLGYGRAPSAGALSIFHPGQMERQGIMESTYSQALFCFAIINISYASLSFTNSQCSVD